MLSLSPALQTTFAVGVVAWPLVAGLTVVLWSKARAAQPQPVPIKVRAR